MHLDGETRRVGLLPTSWGFGSPKSTTSIVPAKGDLCTTVVPVKGDLRTTVIPAQAGTHPRPSNPPSFPRRETLAQPSFPRRREPIPGPRTHRRSRERRPSHNRHSRGGRPLLNRHSRAGGNPSPALEPTVVPAKGDLRTTVIPAAGDLCSTVIPAQAGTHPRPSNPPSFPRKETFAQPSFPRRREPIPESQLPCYDIDHKIADAQRDPAHPIHKFVQAYDEVAAAFHGEDDHDVRAWISGEVPDSYGKYIWQYAPAHPRSIRRRPRPRRGRRSREPGTMAKGESIWIPRPTDRMQEAGIPRPNRFEIWV